MHGLSQVASIGGGTLFVSTFVRMSMREMRLAMELADRRKSHLHQGQFLRLEDIAPDFARTGTGRPTLFAIVTASCEYCEDGLKEVHQQLPWSEADLRVAYLAEEGLPQWLTALGLPTEAIAPAPREVLQRVHLRIVPRWIWLTANGRVFSDRTSFQGDLTIRLLANDLKSLTRKARKPPRVLWGARRA